MTNETDEARKARLLAEAKELKAPVDANWSADQIEKVVNKRRTVLVAAAKAETPAPEAAPAEEAASAEGSDTIQCDEAGDAFADERNELKTTIAALTEERDALKTQNAGLAEKLKISNQAMFDLEAAKSAVEVELFNIKAKANGVIDRPALTEDFGGAKETVAVVQPRTAKPTATATVRCKVTKAGAGKIFTGILNEMYQRDAICDFPPETAASLEAKGWVETD